MLHRSRVWGLLGLFAFYVALAATLPPFDDELYYWCWAQNLQLSYFDHAPLVGWMIRLSTELFGDSVVALRLPAAVAMSVVVGVLWHLTRPRRVFLFALLTPLFTAGGAIVTPDTPLLLGWALYLLWSCAAQRRLDAGRIGAGFWLLGGLALGFGALGKYTMILAVPAGFAAFVLSGRPWRKWLAGYVAHGVVAALVASPVFVFNVQHDFAPLRFQWAHANAADGPTGVRSFGEFVGVQILLMGTLPLWMLPWAARRRRELAADPRLRACLAFYAVPLLFFLYKSVRGHLEGNWGLVCYLGFWPVAGEFYRRWAADSAGRRRLVATSFALPAVCVAVGSVHLFWPLPPWPPARDRLSRQHGRMEVAARVAEEWRTQGEGAPLYCANYQWTALLRYYGADARQLDGATRPSHFTRTPHRLTDSERAVVFNEAAVSPEEARRLGFDEVLAEIPVVVRGEIAGRVQLLRYVRPAMPPNPRLTAGATGRTMSRDAPAPTQAPE